MRGSMLWQDPNQRLETALHSQTQDDITLELRLDEGLQEFYSYKAGGS